MNGVQTRLKCKPNVKRCKRFVFAAHSPLLHPNTLKTKAIIHFQTDHILTRFVFPPLNFKGTFNSLVAGFLETGETLEECVAREVKEETGLEVKNITYFGNQPWPYPSGLMVGFIADYAGGEINLQDEELSSGDFYTRDNLPELPRKLSLARKMIDWWIEHPNE